MIFQLTLLFLSSNLLIQNHSRYLNLISPRNFLNNASHIFMQIYSRSVDKIGDEIESFLKKIN